MRWAGSLLQLSGLQVFSRLFNTCCEKVQGLKVCCRSGRFLNALHG
jgi:hypothetical protein